MSDDRPIKPDQQYLDQFIKKISQVQTKKYLKRRSQPMLSCQVTAQISKQHQRSPQKQSTKSKAQIYKQIKRKNILKFGQKKAPPVCVKQQPKKINPKNMQVNLYKPKRFIQTEEKKQATNKTKVQSTKMYDRELDNKIQYEKLLQIYKKQMLKFQEQKNQFHRQASKLNFKQKIKDEQGLLFSKIRSQIAKSCVSAEWIASQNQPSVSKKQNKKLIQTETVINKPRLTKTYSAAQIKKQLDQTFEKRQQIKTMLLDLKMPVREHKYKISQIDLLPAFDPETLYEYIDPQELNYSKNVLYKQALATFDKKLKNAEQVKKQFVKQKRCSRYEGWDQVWAPGNQRVMKKQQQDYKVAWLHNGDVKQQFGKDIITYFSKSKGILKIQFKKQIPVYYHHQLKQIWRYLENGKRQIVFANGRKQLLPASN